MIRLLRSILRQTLFASWMFVVSVCKLHMSVYHLWLGWTRIRPRHWCLNWQSYRSRSFRLSPCDYSPWYCACVQLKHAATERQDCYVVLRDGTVAFIRLIFSVCVNDCGLRLWACEKKFFCLVKRLSKIRPIFTQNCEVYSVRLFNVGSVIESENAVTACTIDDIVGECGFMKFGSNVYVSVIPCVLERDWCHCIHIARRFYTKCIANFYEFYRILYKLYRDSIQFV